MLLHPKLVHPTINHILAQAGHHSKVLIADGNYPASSTMGKNAQLVSLNLMPGLVNCTQVLEALVTAIPIDIANTMDYERTGQYALTEDPPIWNDYRRIFKDAGSDIELEPIEKWAFYDAVKCDDLVLTIQTAEQQPFANLLLSLGCRTADQ
ncbi:MAG: RbsD/FucU family protein [Planctomycetota bacterium]